ncbi:MAG: extradiol dioxygenase family protein [Bacteroidia bacterium]|jgi:extradiol dioxygenase family protein
MQPFHLALSVRDLASTRDFYTGLLGCQEGRSSDTWIDFDFYGHQLVAHVIEDHEAPALPTSEVDKQAVPVPHFGVVLEWEDWKELADYLQGEKVEFVIKPYTRFEGHPGEQGTMFFRDPSGNTLEFKAFRDPDMLFDKGEDEESDE